MRQLGRVVALGSVLLVGGCVVASGGRSTGGSFLVLLVPLVLFSVIAMVGRAFRRRPPVGAYQPYQDDAPVVSTHMLRAELSVLADDVIRLEPQVALKEEARDDYEAATHRYRVAQAALDDTGASVDLVRVQRVVDEATWSMARARAALDGRPPPGPPTTLRHSGPRGEPAIVLDSDERPAYVGSADSYGSGWFAAGGGLFGGLLMGTMLGGFGGWVDDGDHLEAEDVRWPDPPGDR